MLDELKPSISSGLRWSLLLAVLLGVGLALSAQPARAWPGEPGVTWAASFDTLWSNCLDVAWGDLDGDGDLDIVAALGHYDISLRVYLNQGGLFIPGWQLSSAYITSIALGDYDGDGDLDIAAGSGTSHNRVYANDGSANFSEVWRHTIDIGTETLAWADWDDDGDLDLAVAGYNRPVRIFEYATGAWALAWTAPVTETTTSLAWGDWDNDGDPDLAVGNGYAAGQNRIYSNVEISATRVLTFAWQSSDAASTSSVAWGDWDGDGWLDLVVANAHYNENRAPVQVFLNGGGSLALAWSSPEILGDEDAEWLDWDGDGDLDLMVTQSYEVEITNLRLYRTEGHRLALAWSSADESRPGYALDVGDYDGDGDPDLVMASYKGICVYTNGGNSFEQNLALPGGEMSAALAWGDVNGDGHIDLAVANNGISRIYANDGVTLTLSASLPGSADTRGLAWGDADNDGDLDLAVGNDGAPNALYRNADGVLTLAWTAPFTEATRSLAWADWDGDGDLDLAVANENAPNRVYANDGGALASVWTSAESDPSRSLAWADWDGDGDLDLAVGNENVPNRVYANSGGALALAWTAPFTEETHSVAWGDADGDGYPELAVANWGQGNRVYTNTAGSLTAGWTSPEAEYSTAMAWADYDGDGDLDLAEGNWGQSNRVYVNRAGLLYPAWVSADAGATRGLAWGDFDGDGDLDLASANSANQQNRIYLNNGVHVGLAAATFESASTADPYWLNTVDVAWGDSDGDGDLDLAVGDAGGPNRVYRNDDGQLVLFWTSTETDYTSSVAWGDFDGDGDLDLAVGNTTSSSSLPQQPNRVYENQGATFILAWTSPEAEMTGGVAWGDWDGDGDLDLAVGNWGAPNRVYANDGAGNLTLAWALEDYNYTSDVAWADWDGDGDLDLATGNEFNYLRVYANSGGSLSLAWTATENDNNDAIAWADWDGDGDPDLAVANNGVDRVYRNDGGALTPVWTGADINSHDVTWGDWDNDGDPDAAFAIKRAYSSAVGGYVGEQLYANTGGDLVNRQILSYAGTTASVAWGDWDNDGDLDLAVGNNGQPVHIHRSRAADIQALPDTAPRVRVTTPGGPQANLFHSANILQGPFITITYTLTDLEADPVREIRAYYSTDGGAHWQPAVAAAGTLTTSLAASSAGTGHTFVWNVFESGFSGDSNNTVFRIEACQGFTGAGPYQTACRSARTAPFRMRSSQVRVVSGDIPLENAIVLRLPAGQSGDYVPYRDATGAPLLTDASGYLRGWGQIAIGDHLAALAPITNTASYALYYTNITPTLTGVDAYTVTALGVQTLNVTSDHPLVLLNLAVSLEWDARRDAQFLSQLDFNLRRTSELLYDWTDGQVALGETTIYHDRQNWLDAHVRIYATNRMRPNASQGGIVSEVITDPLVSTITYAPGQVHIGAVWNRYGDPSGALGEDWPRTLAHELGHFALFLDDNYLGFSESGLLIPIDSCPGTAMTDPYRDDFSEFHPLAGWLPGCEPTLSHQTTGRADWQTIETFYPWLSDAANSGPSGLPLAVTELTFVEPVTPTTVLAVPYFYLSQDGHAVQPGLSARTFLFQEDRLIDLGRPTLDQVLARGASPGDRVCVYEPDAGRAGCEVITPGDEQLVLVGQSGWLPDVIVSPVTSQTIVISVTNVPVGVQLFARLYPLNDAAPEAIPLTLVGDVYSGTFNTDFPALDGYLHVWVDEEDPRRETVTDFSIGGNPARLRGRWARLRGRWARLRGRWAPGVSADGQVILFGNLDFAEGEFFTLQAATRIPDPLPWATLVGHAYRLSASPDAPDLTAGSLSFMYAGSEVPAGEESFLRLYFWDGLQWHILPTELDPEHNNASCPVQGPGLYALMSSRELPLYGPGWNNFAYPLLESRPVTQALLSVTGYYTTVYGYEAASATWRMYDVTADPYANDLTTLDYGRGYWINVSESITLYIGGLTTSPVQLLSMSSPPASFYGPVLSGDGFTPAVGMPVSAYVNGARCAEGQTQLHNAEVVYVLHVLADGPGGAVGCGHLGDEIAFEVAGQPMAARPLWHNDYVRRLPLAPLSNTAPTFSSPPVTTATQDVGYTYTITVADPDLLHGDVLTLTAPTLPAWLTLAQTGALTATLTGSPTNADVGEHAVELQVTDSAGLTATQIFTITVANANDPPAFTSAPVLTATQDVGYTTTITAADPDLLHGDALTLTAPTLPAWLTLAQTGALTATLTGAPTNADVGEHTVELRVTDSAGLTATQSFTITVANVNDPPAFTSAPVLTATQDVGYTTTITAADPDLLHGDVLTFTAPTLPGWLTLTDHDAGTATLSGTPTNADVGDHTIVLSVRDSRGASARQEFVITVIGGRYCVFLPLVSRNTP